MGLITKDLWLRGRKGSRKVRALFDTGSTYSLIAESVARRIAEPTELAEPKRFEAAVGTFRAREVVFPDVVLGRKRLPTALIVVSELTEEVILGVDFLQHWHIRLDPRGKRIIVDPKALRLIAVSSRHRPGSRDRRPSRRYFS